MNDLARLVLGEESSTVTLRLRVRLLLSSFISAFLRSQHALSPPPTSCLVCTGAADGLCVIGSFHQPLAMTLYTQSKTPARISSLTTCIRTNQDKSGKVYTTCLVRSRPLPLPSSRGMSNGATSHRGKTNSSFLPSYTLAHSFSK